MKYCRQILSQSFDQGCTLSCLDTDIFLDNIFIYLDTEDIIRLRMVNKFFLVLTEHGSIWKRLLRGTSFPLSPVPPTSRYSLDNLTPLEAERILTRSISLDRNWRNPYPDCLDEWQFDSHFHINSMALVPGGRYLVASTTDASHHSFQLVIYILDHRYGAIPLASMPTEAKVYQLQAKYLNVQDTHGIAISYLISKPKHKSDRQNFDFSNYNAAFDMDIEVPIAHECICLHVALDHLEALGAASAKPGSGAFLHFAGGMPPPFRRLIQMRSSRSFGTVVLDELYGRPYMVVVKPPNQIVFNALVPNTGPVTLNCAAVVPQGTHSIMTICALPEQHQILVARKVFPPEDLSQRPATTLELYHIPLNTQSQAMVEEYGPVEASVRNEEEIVDIFIPNHDVPLWNDESVRRQVNPDVYRGRPLTVYARTANPHGLLRVVLSPQRMDIPGAHNPLQHPQFVTRYSVDDLCGVFMLEAPKDKIYGIIPGSFRSVVYSVSKEEISLCPRVLDLYRYSDDPATPPPPQMQHSKFAYRQLSPLRSFEFEMTGNRLAAMAWDETIGRLCMVNENDMLVYVLDFAKAPKEDAGGRRLPLCLPPLPVTEIFIPTDFATTREDE